MKKILFSVSVLAIVALSAGIFVIVSCNSGKPVGVAERVVDLSASTDPSVDITSQTTGVFGVDSPEAHAYLTSSAPEKYKQTLSKWEAQGYAYAPEYSFVIQGKGLPDSAELYGITDSVFVRITTLAMVYSADPMKQACYSNFVHTDFGDFLQVYLMSFGQTPSDTSFERVIDGVWAKYYDVEMLTGTRTNVDASAWSWKKWGECTARRTAEACGHAAVGCSATGPAYPECVTVGCTAGAVASGITCALTQVFKVNW